MEQHEAKSRTTHQGGRVMSKGPRRGLLGHNNRKTWRDLGEQGEAKEGREIGWDARGTRIKKVKGTKEAL